MNHVLHVAAIVQLRHNTPGRAYYRRKLAAGKTPLEAIRCLKRRLSDAVYRQLVADANLTTGGHSADQGAGPGGHCGATLQSSAVDSHPLIDTSDQPLPGPAEPTLQPRIPTRKTRTKTPLPTTPRHRGEPWSGSARTLAISGGHHRSPAVTVERPGMFPRLGAPTGETGQLEATNAEDIEDPDATIKDAAHRPVLLVCSRWGVVRVVG